jgi:predicted nucleic acid-binding protein
MELAIMIALLDTGFLLAVLDADDEMHKICVAALTEERAPILPDMVIPELAYLVLSELGYPVLIKFLGSIVRGGTGS